MIHNPPPRNLFPLDECLSAVALNSTSNRSAQVVGPASGLLYLEGPEVAYATATTALIRSHARREGKAPISFNALFAGLRYVGEKKIALGAISFGLSVGLMCGMRAPLPIDAGDILEEGASGAGFLRNTMAAGCLLTALLSPRVTTTRCRARILFACFTLPGLANIVSGASECSFRSLAVV